MPRRAAAAVGLALAVAAASSSGCSRFRDRLGGAPPPAAARNLVLVTIDTLRADRLGCYGNRSVETPNLDRMSREGAMAVQSSVHVPLTRPSHVSIFTGLHPAEHGIRDNVSPGLRPDVPTLAEVLHASGFRTGAFVSSIVLSRQSGLNRGFDEYSDRFEADGDDARFLNTIQKRGDGPTAEAVTWLESQGPGRFFVWLHLYDPHDPYEPPEPYRARYADRPYDGEVAWSDELVGRLDAALERRGRRADTLLVVTSDHGEGLEEHGEAVHGYFVYETTLRVPLLFRGPGIAPGTRVNATARSIDLLPTLLDLVGVAGPRPARLPGRSLAAVLRGGAQLPDTATYAESLTPRLHYGWSDLRALREGRWKYILAPRPELYDLETDPGETRNLAATEPARAESLRSRLGGLVAQERAAPSPDAAATVPPDLVEKIGALGYLGAGTTAGGASPGADPKDKLEEYKAVNRLMREGLTRLREKDYPGSAARLQSLLTRGIDSFEVRYYLARALVGQRQCARAEPHFEAAARHLPGFGPAYVGLADCRAAAGRTADALAVLKDGQQKNPRDARLVEAEARLWRRLEKPREAIAAYERALPLAPRDARLRVSLGEMYRDAGDADRAAALMREALKIDAGPGAYWNALGMVLGGKGRFAEAADAFREAVRREPGNAEYAYNLGLGLLRGGHAEEAVPYLRKALEIEPRFRAARERLDEIGGR
jgi:choline-sulfatase